MKAKERGSFNKDVTMKFPRISLTVLKIFVLASVITCSIHICYMCTNLTTVQTMLSLLKIKMLKIHCPSLHIAQSELPYIHFPEPTKYSRNECACTPVRLFVVITIQRSGSGWFETLLNSHINISSNGEVFYNEDRWKNISVTFKTLDEVYNLDWNNSASKTECTASVGFKWMVNQGLMYHYEEISDYLIRRGVSVIFLFRRNRLRQLISLLANTHDKHAKQLNGTHKAHVYSQYEADILAHYKPVIEVKSLIRKLKQLHDWANDAFEHLKSTRHTVLYYEDLIQNRTKTKEIIEFLKVPERPLVSRRVKIHTKSLSHLVQNWVEVQHAITGSEYESYLTHDY